jgi:hypothetical protein
MRSRRKLALILVAACVGLPGAELYAQELRGRVVDAESSGPVVGAMVMAVGAAGEVRQRTLTDERGEFVLRIPAASPVATYQVVRIGYASQDFPVSALSAAEDRVLRISSAPVELEGIGVVAENLCGEDLAGSGQVYDIWLETRKALEMTRLTQAQTSLRFDAELVSRVLDPRSLGERNLRVQPRVLRGLTPYYSLTGEQMTRGWIETEGDGSLRYWAPDANALLSAEFEEQHCFGAELEREKIVLRFTPNRSRADRPDIQGEVFLDRATHRLERLRFEYTSLPLPREAAGHASGEVHFAAAPNGSWVVTRWWIRMPVVTATWEQDHVRSFQRARVVELLEEGGRILRIRSGSGVVPVTQPPPA